MSSGLNPSTSDVRTIGTRIDVLTTNPSQRPAILHRVPAPVAQGTEHPPIKPAGKNPGSGAKFRRPQGFQTQAPPLYRRGVVVDAENLVALYLYAQQAAARTPATTSWHRASLKQFLSWLNGRRPSNQPERVERGSHPSPDCLLPNSTVAARVGDAVRLAVNSLVRSLRAFCYWLTVEELVEAEPGSARSRCRSHRRWLSQACRRKRSKKRSPPRAEDGIPSAMKPCCY